MAHSAARPASTEHLPYYSRYVDLVPDGDVLDILESQVGETLALLGRIPESKADGSYEPGKWSVKELVGHVVDTERIFAYRALRFARGDQAPLRGFDQDEYVAGGGFAARSLADLASELEHLRRANVLFFQGLAPEAWDRRGIANDAEVTVRALAYILAGHEIHHRAILRDRYLPALGV